MSNATWPPVVLAALFAPILLSAAPASAEPGASPGGPARHHVIVLAHRACWGAAPEVSISAIENCLVVGADAVEIDVRETRDGALVLMHDETVDRTTDGSGRVAAMSAAQIRALHLRAGAGGPGALVTRETVPTVEEALAAAKGRLLVNLHLKTPAEAKVAELVKRMKMTDQVITWVYAKPDDPGLLNSPLKGAVGLVPVISECGPQYPEPCWTASIRSLEPYAAVRPVAFFLDFRQSHAFIRAVSGAKRTAGARIFVETLGPIDDLPPDGRRAAWRSLLDMGVSVIMTDHPGDLADFLKTTDLKVPVTGSGPLLKPIAPAPTGTPGGPVIIAHRGGAALMPENTLPAFDNAIRLGVEMLEFDMVMTADDHLIIQHDPTVNPAYCTADPASGVTPRPVRELTLAQLLTFDCGSRHRDIYPRQQAAPGTRMPTLSALLARYKGGDTQFFGEIKMPGPNEGDVDPAAFARLVDAEVRNHGLEERFIVQSSDWRALDAMHELNPRIRTCLLGVWRAEGDHLDIARAHHATCMLLRLQDADAAEVKRLREAGVMVVSEVIDDETSWGQYLARGDDALFTNDPAALTTFLRGAANRGR